MNRDQHLAKRRVSEWDWVPCALLIGVLICMLLARRGVTR